MATDSDVTIVIPSTSADMLRNAVAQLPTGRWHVLVKPGDPYTHFDEILRPGFCPTRWLVHHDEDALLIRPDAIMEIIAEMERTGAALAGMPDGGNTLRRHSPVVINPFFAIFDMHQCEGEYPAVEDLPAKTQGLAALAPEWALKKPFAYDEFEPYYRIFGGMLLQGLKPLYLRPSDLVGDFGEEPPTILHDLGERPFVVHSWYGRRSKTHPGWMSARMERCHSYLSAERARQHLASAGPFKSILSIRPPAYGTLGSKVAVEFDYDYFLDSARFEPQQRALGGAIQRLFEFATAVEFGCGNAYLSAELRDRGAEVLCVDTQLDALRCIGPGLAERFCMMDITQPGGRHILADLSIAANVLEHIDPTGIWGALNRVCNAAGRHLVVAVQEWGVPNPHDAPFWKRQIETRGLSYSRVLSERLINDVGLSLQGSPAEGSAIMVFERTN